MSHPSEGGTGGELKKYNPWIITIQVLCLEAPLTGVTIGDSPRLVELKIRNKYGEKELTTAVSRRPALGAGVEVNLPPPCICCIEIH